MELHKNLHENTIVILRVFLWEMFYEVEPYFCIVYQCLSPSRDHHMLKVIVYHSNLTQAKKMLFRTRFLNMILY